MTEPVSISVFIAMTPEAWTDLRQVDLIHMLDDAADRLVTATYDRGAWYVDWNAMPTSEHEDGTVVRRFWTGMVTWEGV